MLSVETMTRQEISQLMLQFRFCRLQLLGPVALAYRYLDVNFFYTRKHAICNNTYVSVLCIHVHVTSHIGNVFSFVSLCIHKSFSKCISMRSRAHGLFPSLPEARGCYGSSSPLSLFFLTYGADEFWVFLPPLPLVRRPLLCGVVLGSHFFWKRTHNNDHLTNTNKP